MYVVITHLTRMRPGFICVAGIEPSTGRQIRPVLRGQLTRDLLRQNGGPFEIGGAIHLGETLCVGSAPEVEDHLFDLRKVRYLRRLCPNEFWTVLTKTTNPSLTTLFGNQLQLNKIDRSCTCPEKTGCASLGHFRSSASPRLAVNHWGRLRIDVADPRLSPELPVTDVRLFRSDQQTVRISLIDSLAKRLRDSNAVLAVGLTRPYRKQGDPAPCHWLQVNNIHLHDDPLGDSLAVPEIAV